MPLEASRDVAASNIAIKQTILEKVKIYLEYITIYYIYYNS